MLKFFKIICSHKYKPTERNVVQVISWWEIRRVFYNLFITFWGLINLFCFTFVVNGALDFVSGLSIIGFYFFANFLYTLGWIIEIILRFFNKNFSAKISILLFKIGLIISFITCFFPTILFGIIWPKNGEKKSSPYSDFTYKKPKWEDIVGEYKFSKESIKKLEYSDSLNSNFLFKLNLDSTFEMKSFPNNISETDINEHDIINVKGKWKLDEDFGFGWMIQMTYEKPTNIKSDNKQNSFLYKNTFKLKGEKKPYKIYIIIGDPDSWEGLTLEKISTIKI